MLHVHGGGVGRDVDLGDHIEEESLLDLGSADQCVKHGGDEADLGQELLYDLR